MATSPELDVVVPTLGQKSSLKRTVKALLRQPNVNQVIVVASGPHNSGAIVAAVEALRDVTVVRSTTRLLAGAARNLGSTVSETEFLAFCDDDDIWTARVGQLLADIASESGIAAGTLHKLNADQTCSAVWNFGETIGVGDVHYWNPGVTGSNIVVSRALFEESGKWSEVLPSMNDIEFLTRATVLSRIPVVREAAVLLDLSHHQRIGAQRPKPADDIRQFLAEPLAARGCGGLEREAQLQLARFERRLPSQILRHPENIGAAARLLRHTIRKRIPYGELGLGCGRDHRADVQSVSEGAC